MRKQRKMRLIALLITAVAALLIFGYIRFFNGKLIYISTGFGKDDLFKTGNNTATLMEAKILLSDAKTEYEALFGSDIWQQSIGDVSFDDFVKDQVKTKLERVYCMNVMADKNGVVLSRSQRDAVEDAADEYYGSLTEDQIKELNVTKEKLVNMFTRFAVAQTLYNDMTESMDIEVSYDEARVITIQYICADTMEDIEAAKKRLDNNEIFYVVARDYNPDEYERECRRGELDESFEEAAYNLASGEVSGIIEAGGKYYIIKCSSDNDKSKTEANRTAILERRRLEAFNQEFEPFEAKQFVEFNSKAWDKIKTSSVGTISVKFEEIYNSYLN